MTWLSILVPVYNVAPYLEDGSIEHVRAGDRRHLDEILVRAGFAVVGGTPLFCLVEHPEALSLADKLARHGIHVRRFDANVCKGTDVLRNFVF